MGQWRDDLVGVAHIWKRAFVGLFSVLFLLRLLAGNTLLPLFGGSMKLAVRLAGYSYLNLQNVGAFFCHPTTWLFVILWVAIYAAFCLLEQYIATYTIRLKEQKLEFRLLDFIRFTSGFFKDKKKRQLYALLPVVLLQNLFSNGIMIIFALAKWRIPRIIWTDLATWGPAMLGVSAFWIGLEILAFLSLFVAQYYILEGKGKKESREKNRNLLRHNVFRTLRMVFILFLGIALISIVFYFLLMTILAGLLILFTENRYVLAKLLAMYDSINFVVGFLISTISCFLFQTLTTHLFYQYKEERNELTSAQLAYGYVEKNQLRRYLIAVRVLAGLVVLISIVSSWNIIHNGAFQPNDLFSAVEITAHRGLSASAPENTLPALELAIEQAADYAEIDVRQTLDGVVVLMHDSNLKRTCGVSKQVRYTSYEEILQMDAGGWFSEEYRGVKVPTLEEVMELCKGNINLNIELKVAGDAEQLAGKVVALIEEYDMERQCVLTSTNYNVLLEVKKRNDIIRTGYIMSMAYGNYYEKEGIDFFSMKSGFVTQSTVERLHELGKEIHVWTVNRKTELQRVRNIGVDNIITDDVILARKTCFEETDGTFWGILMAILKG